MGENRQVNSLILLVGSNPLPNYLATMALKPSKIHLVYSGETKGPKERLHTALCADLPGLIVDADAYVADPFSASLVGDTLRDLMASLESIHLHYTGGTKVMSAHARMAFFEKGGRPENASYLDEGHARLRFDDNVAPRLLTECGVLLTLNRILQLHAVTYKERSPITGGPGVADVRAIATAVLTRPQLASCLYGERKRLEDGTFNDAKSTPCNTNDYGLALTAPIIPPKEGMNKKCFEAWYKFIGGEWLEDWVAGKIGEIGLAGNPEITVGVNCARAATQRPFEVDVAVVRGQRPYFISCTTDMTRSICKSKAFEISVRARHLGGDLARSALVSLLPGTAVTDIQEDVADAWGSANATRIFGLEDIKLWSGHCGAANLGSFKDWLDS